MSRATIMWLLAALFDWAMIAIAAILVVSYPLNPLAWLAALILVGRSQHALGVLGHDAAHRLICKNTTWNNLLGNIFVYWPLMLSMESYRIFHFSHHRHLGTELDPEMSTRAWEGKAYHVPLYPMQMAWHVLKCALGMAAPHAGTAVIVHRPIVLSDVWGPLLWWKIAAWACWYAELGEVVILWFLSLPTFLWVFFRLRTWCEHVGTDGTHRIAATWWQKFLFVPHNTWAHWEHHHFPQVPFSELPALRRQLTGPDVITIGQLFGGLGTARGGVFERCFAQRNFKSVADFWNPSPYWTRRQSETSNPGFFGPIIAATMAWLGKGRAKRIH